MHRDARRRLWLGRRLCVLRPDFLRGRVDGFLGHPLGRPPAKQDARCSGKHAVLCRVAGL
jgi:hypothetical protein